MEQIKHALSFMITVLVLIGMGGKTAQGQGTGLNPSINAAFLPQLQALCPQNGDGYNRVALDTGSQNRFETSFFTNLMNGLGILESDYKLWIDASTRPLVQRYLGGRGNFPVEFAKSMVKMSNIGVKTSTLGEIRKVCSRIN